MNKGNKLHKNIETEELKELQSTNNFDLERNPEYEKIGGWLMLVGFGLVTNSVRLIFDIRKLYNLNSEISENHLLYGLLQYELYTSILVLILLSILIFLFVNKRKVFPKFIISYFLITCLLNTFEYFSYDYAFEFMSKQNISIGYDPIINIISGYIILFVWGTYFVWSKRVKDTFVN